MNPRLEKLRAERDKLAEKYNNIGLRLKNLNDEILKLENTDIIGIVRENGLTIDQLAELLKLLDKKPTAALPVTFEKTEDWKDEE